MVAAETRWRQLCRLDDPVLARAVATSIAAMEFDVQLHAPDADSGDPPYVIEVLRCEWGDLADVLDEIIDEQIEFDRLLAERQAAGAHHARIVVIVTMTGAVDLLLLFGLLEL